MTPINSSAISPDSTAVKLEARFSEDMWLSPNDFLRSALFGIFKRDRLMLPLGKRLVLHDFPTFKLTLWGGPPLEVEGPNGTTVEQVVAGAFDQMDHDVFMLLLHQSAGVIGAPQPIHAYTLLEKLGRKGTGAANAQILRNSIARLSSTHITLKFKHKKTPAKVVGSALTNAYEGADELPSNYTGTLLTTIFNPNTNTYSVSLDANIQNLMGKSYYSSVNWQERLSLSSPLAKWLHGFFSTHAKPDPVAVESLHGRTGSKASLKEFRRTLKGALDELKELTSMSGTINEDDQLVMKRAVVSTTQKRALVKKARKLIPRRPKYRLPAEEY